MQSVWFTCEYINQTLRSLKTLEKQYVVVCYSQDQSSVFVFTLHEAFRCCARRPQRLLFFLSLQIKTCSISDWCVPEAVWCVPTRPSSDISWAQQLCYSFAKTSCLAGRHMFMTVAISHFVIGSYSRSALIQYNIYCIGRWGGVSVCLHVLSHGRFKRIFLDAEPFLKKRSVFTI